MKRIAIFLTLTLTRLATAHDFYLMPEKFQLTPGQTLRIGVHNGDGFPESQSAPPMQRLKDAFWHTSTGATEIKNLRQDGKRAIGQVTAPKSGHAIATIVSSANTADMESGEFDEYLKEEGLTQVLNFRAKNSDPSKKPRERSTKFAKSILVVGDGDESYKKVIGLPIEIVPDKDPYKIKPGAFLPVRVMLKGVPTQGIQVIAASAAEPTPQAIGKTDRLGRISIPVTSRGPWRLHAIQMEPCSDQTVAEWESYWTTLTFEIR